jgi:hypothetical protein
VKSASRPAGRRAVGLRRSINVPACLILCGLLAVGCAAKDPKPPDDRSATVQAVPSKPKRPFLLSWLGKIPSLIPRKAAPPQAQVPRLIGIIKTVSKEDRFVLIDATTFQGAESGDLLVCIREQKETANLRMSNLKNPPFLIADIASGTPSPGDRVFKP